MFVEMSVCLNGFDVEWIGFSSQRSMTSHSLLSMVCFLINAGFNLFGV